MARYLGTDLHRNCFTVCIRTKTRKVETKNWPMDALGQFVKTLKKSDQVVVESTGNTRLFYEAIVKLMYLALQTIARKWTMPIQHWKPALNQLAIRFESRLHLGDGNDAGRYENSGLLKAHHRGWVANLPVSRPSPLW